LLTKRKHDNHGLFWCSGRRGHLAWKQWPLLLVADDGAILFDRSPPAAFRGGTSFF
jgi:hypothetical protein